ncbi:peptidoglycan editing factor PgeF [Mangrovibacterium sp.]|uniref:peptidoglycan editing factor PgeF n=1 Tax=Mangrovibacterium sp. TaxID=1961364 RepID=UPI00356393E6
MKKQQAGNKTFYQFEQLLQNGLLHFTSTKRGWAGDGKSRFTGDSPESFAGYRAELAASLGLNGEQFVFPRQTHSDHIQVVHEPMSGVEVPDTDALITDVTGLCICVQTADCVPILLFDPFQRVVAAIHSGWRGTVSKIAAKTLERMQTEFQSKPENILAGIGPSISSKNYEVSADVIQQIERNFPNQANLLHPSANTGRACLDLWAANKSLLMDSGVPENQIEITGFCSFAGDHEFYSARRDGLQTGRMVTGIMLSGI